MNIISWNVNGLRAINNKGYFAEIIAAKPDILCFQETKAEAEQLPEGVRNPEGYFSYFSHSKMRKGYSGVAVYSRTKPEKVEEGMGVKDMDQEGRLLVLYYKDFVLLNCYFPNGGGGPERRPALPSDLRRNAPPQFDAMQRADARESQSEAGAASDRQEYDAAGEGWPGRHCRRHWPQGHRHG